MRTKPLITALLSLITLSTVAAQSIPVYFGTYTRPNNSSKGIYRSVLDLETGKLSPPTLVAELKSPSFIEIHPNAKYLYAVSEAGGSGTVTAFAIDPTSGALKLLNQQPSQGSGPCHVNIDRTGKNVLVANYGSGSAAVIPIKPDGALAKPTGFTQHKGSSINQRRQKAPHAHSINPSPDNRYAYVADLGIDKVMIYKLDPEDGTITPNNPPSADLKPGAGPRHFAFAPNGKHAYVINELHCTITAFDYDPATGALDEIQTITTLPNGFDGSNSCAEVRVHPTGKFLYGSNRGHDSIAVYKIDPAKGTLTFVEHETDQIKTPRNFNIDPTGKFCLVANQAGNSVVIFRIDQKTGALNPTGHKIEIASPVCIRFLQTPATKVLIVYYSRSGNTETMAEAVAEGADEVPGVITTLRKVADATKQDLQDAHGIILGSPTYFANIPGQMTSIIDTWNWKMGVDFTDKIGGAFATGGNQAAGHGHVVTSLLLYMLNNRMIIAGPLYKDETYGIIWGEPGAAAVTGPPNLGVSDYELSTARKLGKRIATLAKKVNNP